MSLADTQKLKAIHAERKLKRELCKSVQKAGKRVQVIGHYVGDFAGDVVEVNMTYVVVKRGEESHDIIFDSARFAECE